VVADREATEAVWKLKPTRLGTPFGRPGVQGVEVVLVDDREIHLRSCSDERRVRRNLSDERAVRR